MNVRHYFPYRVYHRENTSHEHLFFDLCTQFLYEIFFNWYNRAMNRIEGIKKYIRAADYLSAAQIYLKDNALLEEPLERKHIKERLLGHWGTCPGINFLYAHLNRSIIEHDLNMLFVLGPGHGFPAIQANLFIEGTLSKYYPHVKQNKEGIEYMCRQFSWPYGFPSHSNPTAPGVILEGGELGYSLSTSYGAILDNPDLIAACMVGDGEAETGPTATAWHISKLIDPATNGAVLPILHLNGYKISGPTLFGRMSNEELLNLFKGYGYVPHIVDADGERDVHEHMIDALDISINSIRSIQKEAREGNAEQSPRWPMIILRTPKGWHSIPELHGHKIEGNHLSHQVIAGNAHADDEEFNALQNWLASYNIRELFEGEAFHADIQAITPLENRRMGDNPHTFGGEPHFKPLNLPGTKNYEHPVGNISTSGFCSMNTVGGYMRDVMEANKSERNFRLMSPDETYSNKLDPVFEVTNRAFVWPHREWDLNLARDGRVLEMLSEHSLQGLSQGYVLTGRHMVFASYEAFVQIVSSMTDQYSKFLSIALDVPWRGDVGSLNYILTSTGWQQEHNGFSHQNPGFIDSVLQRQSSFVNVYFPADANTSLVVMNKMLSSKNGINVLVASKKPAPVWRTQEQAIKDLEEGISIWEAMSDEDPHMVFSAVGDYLVNETLAAVHLVKQEVPDMRLRFVNISTLSALGIGPSRDRILNDDIDFYYTKDKKAIINFHGYPQTMKQILFDYNCDSERFIIRGYEEQGSTTTTFDMQIRNRTDRYNLAMEAFKVAESEGLITVERKDELIKKYQDKLTEHRAYIVEYGKDPEEIENWKSTCNW
jgi:xylulose-5-phosphate/fructose-6-phosphate phosphoketolase